ncbi:MAG: nucleoside triphosphate pyrophosphohydrolase [Bacilli bacterium]|nr:nucleoside triphosphate pyrophosphohydrolase [Bacilli bacterium]
MIIYNKLVRDKIIDKIKLNNEIPVIRKLDNDEYKIELIKKLKEEMNELLEAIELENDLSILEESADVFEVIKYINILSNNSMENIIDEMNLKHDKKGGFDEKIYLEKVI